jgi:hypothetical protein
MATSPSTLQLELGDIIQIEAHKNDILHDQVFLIQYIDNNTLTILNTSDLETTNLRIQDGVLADESIQSISILDKPSEKGYARQNGLLPGKWIQLHFGGDVPTIITGRITNLDEDMIEIEMYPDKETIYIDFGYKGLPKNIPLESIQIRDAPLLDTTDQVMGDDDMDDSDIPERDEDELGDADVDVIGESKITKPMVRFEEARESLKNVLVEADEIVFGDNIDTITQNIQVSEDEKRFSIEQQSNDLLDEILSTIPNTNRTKRVLNNIHLMINRFQELRSQFSKVDEHKNITGALKHGAKHKPLIEKLLKFHKNLYWILPVVQNKVIIHDEQLYGSSRDPDVDIPTDVVPTSNAVTFETLKNIMSNYEGTSFPMDGNNYELFVKGMKTFFTPFEQPDNTSDLLANIRVNDDVHVVIDNIVNNLQDFYSSVITNDNYNRRRFVMSRYNLGQKGNKIVESTGSMMKTELTNITKGDKLPLKSIMTLPESFVHYSHISLPGSTIYDKTNLNHTPISYWKFLRKNTSIVTQTLTDLNKSEDETDIDTDSEMGGLFTKIKNIVLDDGVDVEKKYEKFLQAVIPKTNTIFELMKKYIQNGTSLHEVLYHLQPFMIHREDITYKQYESIIEFTNNNIQKLKQTFAIHEKDTNVLRNLKLKILYGGSILLNSLTPEIKTTIQDAYKIKDDRLFTSEFYTTLIHSDYGKLYSMILSYMNNSLASSININDQLQDIIQQLERSIQTDSTAQNETCKNYVLTKKYTSIDSLQSDNGKEDIYYDSEFDKTDYSILKMFATEQQTMDSEEFRIFLIQSLKENKGLTDDEAIEYAETLLEGRKRVNEGDYALLDIEETDDAGNKSQLLYFYKRLNNIWDMDTEVTQISHNNISNKVFCNVQDQCIENMGTSNGKNTNSICHSLNVSKEQFMKSTLEDLLQNAVNESSDHSMSSDEFQDKIQELIQRLKSVQSYTSKTFTKYNDSLYEIGLTTNQGETIVSPHAKLRDRILSQTDLIERMKNISLFIDKFTRGYNPESDESTYWFYCIDTNTKLLPTFFYTLSTAFLTGADYLDTLEKICADRGEMSDDGDKWVDKHSGYTIRMIDYSTDEGYDESGFRIQTHEVLSEDEPILFKEPEKMKEDVLVESPIGVLTKKVLYALSYYSGMNVMNNANELIKLIITHVSKQLPSKEKYNKKLEAMEKKGKRMISYEMKLYQTLMYFTGMVFFIEVQTSIPEMKTKKTFPGCTKSFSGYPFQTVSETKLSKKDVDDDYDQSGLEYVACIMKKISSSNKPWVGIKGVKEASIVNNMKLIYDKILYKDGVIQGKMSDKRNYIESGDYEIDIPDDVHIKQWTTFQPPLIQYTLPAFKELSSRFYERLQSNMQSGSSKQFVKISKMDSAIKYKTMDIMRKINNVVDNEKALLETVTGEPYLQNICCNSDDSISTMDYFIERNKSILNEMREIDMIQQKYYEYVNVSKAPLFYSNKNTKIIYPKLSTSFNDTTIYLAFLKFCKYNTDLPIPEDLRTICINNNSAFNKTDSLEEKIQILKNEGKNYTESQLKSLLNIIYNKNAITGLLNTYSYNNAQMILQLLDYFDRKDSDFALKLRNILRETIETNSFYAISKDSSGRNKYYDHIRNYVLASIETLQTECVSFLQTHGSMGRNTERKVIEFIETIADFKELNGTMLMNSQEETILYTIQYMNNMMMDMMRVLPYMLLNNVKYKNMKIPKHWKLSKIHQSDIQSFMMKNYEMLNKFYENSTLQPILESIQQETSDIYKLMKQLHLYTTYMVDGREIQPLMNSEIIVELYQFMFLSIVKSYINQQDSMKLDIAELGGKEPTDELVEVDVISGDKLELQQHIAELLVSYMEIFLRRKKRILYNRESIMKLVLRSKESEKDSKTRKLKSLTDEERRADNELKRAKLGQWNIGLQKGLTRYVKETYDAERAEMESEAVIQRELEQNDDVTTMNREIFEMDFIDEAMREGEMDAEAYNMSALPDDDDYGDNDGDEGFY